MRIYTLRHHKKIQKKKEKSKTIQHLQQLNNNHKPLKSNLLTVIFLKKITLNFHLTRTHRSSLLSQTPKNKILKGRNLIWNTSINSKLKLFSLLKKYSADLLSKSMRRLRRCFSNKTSNLKSIWQSYRLNLQKTKRKTVIFRIKTINFQEDWKSKFSKLSISPQNLRISTLSFFNKKCSP